MVAERGGRVAPGKIGGHVPRKISGIAAFDVMQERLCRRPERNDVRPLVLGAVSGEDE